MSGWRPSSRQYPHTSSDCFPVEVHSGIIYEALDSTGLAQTLTRLGQISCNRTIDLLRRLEDDGDVALEFYCRGVRPQLKRAARRLAQVKEYELLVNVFGNEVLAEEFGVFFEKLVIYLQDPVACNRNVPYRNPHLLAQDDKVVMTSSLGPKPNVEIFVTPADIFDTLLYTGNLPEAECPTMLRTPLLTHQKQALYFMRRSESTSRIGDSPHHMWTEKRMCGIVYTNTITSESQKTRPKDFFGGLIADQMGLGKTLQMISLLASDHDLCGELQASIERTAPLAQTESSYCSLVILPTSLLQTWQDQIREHLKPDSLRWHVYHGSRRQILRESISSYHVILTTYDVVASEYRNLLRQSVLDASTPIFSLTWTRVILDEAHCIRNLSTLRAKAVCAIKAKSRWTVTGTPIQNRLTDLTALIHFLRVEPFDRPGTFDEHIIQPWKSRSDFKAVQKLRKLIESIAIRRSKDLLVLPNRTDQIRHVDFDDVERRLYEKARLLIRDNAINSTSTPNHYNILRWINDLRGLCSHGQINMDPNQRDTLEDSPVKGSTQSEDLTNDLAPMDTLLDTDPLEAGRQGTVTLAAIEESDFAWLERTPNQELSPSWQPNYRRNYENSVPGFLSPMTIGGTDSPSVSSSSIDEHEVSSSSKIQALLSDLCGHDGKAVVFSFWRTTLDLVARSLDDLGLAFKRIDGALAHRDRELNLHSFRDDPSIKVLLATISAAGVGLDITVANLACLLEPQWNPSVEEQALSRVHRMRQTKPVKTIRYVVRDSIEENIIELQQRKLRLAQLALSGEGSAVGKAWMEDLKILLK